MKTWRSRSVVMWALALMAVGCGGEQTTPEGSAGQDMAQAPLADAGQVVVDSGGEMAADAGHEPTDEADGGGEPAGEEMGAPVVDQGTDASMMVSDDMAQAGPSPVGGECVGPQDCAGGEGAACFEESEGFVGGYCVVEGCDTRDCPDGSTCWRFQDGAHLCLQDCQAAADCRDGYVCDEDDTCWPGTRCTVDSCGAGMQCGASGRCELDTSGVPAGGPPASCPNVPDWKCGGSASFCGELVPFLPEHGEGYWNYPLNGETAQNQYRSFARRDVMMLVKYAAAQVACKAAGWAGNGGELGLGDMSERDGAIPGTSVGRPGHPPNTHVDGKDMDIAYFQVNTPDNKLRAICPHEQGGQDQYHCVAAADRFDLWRTALFIAHLHDAVIGGRNQLRVVGVDGKVGPMIEGAVGQLCAAGWYSGPACSGLALAYEVSDTNRGWFHFHHHHLHISTLGLTLGAQPLVTDAGRCLEPHCPMGPNTAPARDPRRHYGVEPRSGN